LTLTTALSTMTATNSKFKIKTFHSSPYTYARKAVGGLAFDHCDHCKTVLGFNSSTFTKNLMSGYKIIGKISSGPETGMWESRTVVSIDSATQLTVDTPFSGDILNDATTYYNYESCPSLTYENFDMRTENGFGVISSDGTNHVYDNVQYAKITSPSISVAGTTSQAAEFTHHLKEGYTITMDGITRTVTKVVDNTMIQVDRAFKEGVQHTKYSYRYSVRKTGDYHLHWKPSTVTGDYHQTATASDSNINSRQLIATAAGGVNIPKQDKYLQYPPVCYNTGRCVSKTSHSLVGVETAAADVQVSPFLLKSQP